MLPRPLTRSSRAHVLDEGRVESRPLSRGDIEAPSLGARRGEREGDCCVVGLDGAHSWFAQSLQPTCCEPDVPDLVLVDALTHDRALLVAGGAKGVAVEQAEVEVRLLECEAPRPEDLARAVA